MKRKRQAPAVQPARSPDAKLETAPPELKDIKRGEKEQASFDEDVRYYRENLSYFLNKYKGKYIAFINKAVVDKDEDFSQLAKRVFARHGNRDIFMPKVTEKEEVVHIPTPFLERSSVGSI